MVGPALAGRRPTVGRRKLNAFDPKTAILCGISGFSLLVLSGILFEKTRPLTTVFYHLQHMVTPETVSKPAEYVFGLRDIWTVFYYASQFFLLATLASDGFQSDPFSMFHRQLTDLNKQTYALNCVNAIFCLFSIVLGIMALCFSPMNLETYWNGYGNTTVPFVMKLFYILQISYWLAAIPMVFFTEINNAYRSCRVVEALSYLALLCATAHNDYSHVACSILILHYLVKIIYHASDAIRALDNDPLARKVLNVYNIASICEAVTTLIMTVALLNIYSEKSLTSRILFAGYVHAPTFVPFLLNAIMDGGDLTIARGRHVHAGHH